jgi:ABC-type nitrate/sulfonate/bicarbonate transport system substrate-binding protein
VDTVAAEPAFGARCLLVLGRHLPMAALFVEGRPAPVHPIRSPHDLVSARYGGEATSAFVQEHRALLRRLGGDDPALHVEMPYDALFGALALGRIDVAPDYAGILSTYQRATGPAERVRALPYRDCGVRAYGTGLVASGQALQTKLDAIVAFLAVTTSAYEAMRADPEATVKAASASLANLDVDYALREWRQEEEPSIFDPAGHFGHGDRSGWEDTVAWRHEVVGFPDPPEPDSLYESPP